MAALRDFQFDLEHRTTDRNAIALMQSHMPYSGRTIVHERAESACKIMNPQLAITHSHDAMVPAH
jgi:hypothetical protein